MGAAGRHAADGHPQGVHRAEGVDLPAAAAPAADRGPDGVLPGAGAPVPSAERLRVPHPRGRGERLAGARVHARRRVRLRRAGAAAGARRRSLRARPVVLLQRPHRLLRGDREVPGGAAHLGALAPRALRRHRRVVDAPSLPHADRGGLAHGPAADEQRGAHRRRGARRRARRHAVPAHQRARRGARAPHRGRRQAGAPDAADHRARDGRSRRDRPAGRLVLPRVAHRPDGGARGGRVRPDPGDGPGVDARGRPGRDRARLLPAGDRRVGVPRAGAVRGRGPREGRGHPLRRGGRGPDRRPRDPRGDRARPGRARPRRPGEARRGGRGRCAVRPSGARRRRGEPGRAARRAAPAPCAPRARSSTRSAASSASTPRRPASSARRSPPASVRARSGAAAAR